MPLYSTPPNHNCQHSFEHDSCERSTFVRPGPGVFVETATAFSLGEADWEWREDEAMKELLTENLLPCEAAHQLIVYFEKYLNDRNQQCTASDILQKVKQCLLEFGVRAVEQQERLTLDNRMVMERYKRNFLVFFLVNSRCSASDDSYLLTQKVVLEQICFAYTDYLNPLYVSIQEEARKQLATLELSESELQMYKDLHLCFNTLNRFSVLNEHAHDAVYEKPKDFKYALRFLLAGTQLLQDSREQVSSPAFQLMLHSGPGYSDLRTDAILEFSREAVATLFDRPPEHVQQQLASLFKQALLPNLKLLHSEVSPAQFEKVLAECRAIWSIDPSRVAGPKACATVQKFLVRMGLPSCLSLVEIDAVAIPRLTIAFDRHDMLKLHQDPGLPPTNIYSPAYPFHFKTCCPTPDFSDVSWNA